MDDLAVDPPPAVEVELHGDVKTFAVGVFLNGAETALPGAEPPPDVVGFGQGVGDFRLKASASGRMCSSARLQRCGWRLEVHHALSMVASSGGALLGTSTGVALTAPQLVPLTWEPEVGDGLLVRGRVDRLVLSLTPGPVSVTIGRQPVSFGTGLAFAPLDLVNPFFPATIDNEYKPGVDAARVDVYAGTTGRVSAVAAWAGALPPTDRDAEPVDSGDVVLALNGQGTVGVTDLQGFLGLVRGDQVAGVAVASSVGPLGVHGDVTVTNPGPEAVETDPFVRVVIGGEGRPSSTTTIAVEGYVQSLGASDPADYLAELTNPRFLRGEVWLLGQAYASLSVIQEITPLLSGSASVIANLGDPSGLVVPSLSWSLADEATVGVGGYLSVGARRDGPLDPPVSEFGLYPTAVFVRMSGYF